MEENEKNKEDKDANQEKNKNNSQLSFSVLTMHEFKEKNKKTKFTPKSNNRWILVPIKKEDKDKKEVITSDKDKNKDDNHNKEEQNKIIDNDSNIEKDKTMESQNEVDVKKSKINSDEEKVMKTLEKWKNLQKSIKEEISLEELMIEKQKQDSSQLREKFKDYYNVKLQSRYEYEKIKNLNSNDKIISNKE